jgi:hypothetical protein
VNPAVGFDGKQMLLLTTESLALDLEEAAVLSLSVSLCQV